MKIMELLKWDILQDTIAVLLRYGAECNCASYPLGSVGGFTPADLASMHNHNGIAAYLSESHLAQRLSRLRVSDDRGSSVRKRNRNIPVNIPVGLSHSNDDSAEQEVCRHDYFRFFATVSIQFIFSCIRCTSYPRLPERRQKKYIRQVIVAKFLR